MSTIGIVYESLYGGGAPFVVRQQIRHFCDIGHSVVFITSASEVSRGKLLFPKVRCVGLLRTFEQPLLKTYWRFAILVMILSLRLDVVIIHSVRTASYFGFFARLCGCRVIVVEHDFPEVARALLSSRQRLTLKFVLQRAIVVCVSRGSADAFERFFGVPARAIYNFADLNSGSSHDRKVERNNSIVFLGRLVTKKRVDVLLECYEKIASRCAWSLEIHGDGVLGQDLRMKAAQSRYSDRIKFGGWTDQTREVLERAGLFVQTSAYEGFGIALLEAMSVGTPCVSFDCPFGPSEIIVSGVSGILVRNGCIDELAEAVLKLINDPELREKLGASAITRAAEFSKRAHLDAWDRVIEDVNRR